MAPLLRVMFRAILAEFLRECERKQLINYSDAIRAGVEVEPFLARLFPD